MVKSVVKLNGQPQSSLKRGQIQGILSLPHFNFYYNAVKLPTPFVDISVPSLLLHPAIGPMPFVDISVPSLLLLHPAIGTMPFVDPKFKCCVHLPAVGRDHAFR